MGIPSSPGRIWRDGCKEAGAPLGSVSVLVAATVAAATLGLRLQFGSSGSSRPPSHGAQSFSESSRNSCPHPLREIIFADTGFFTFFFVSCLKGTQQPPPM